MKKFFEGLLEEKKLPAIRKKENNKDTQLENTDTEDWLDKATDDIKNWQKVTQKPR